MNNISKTFTSYNELYNNLVKTNNIEICKFCLDNDGIWKRLELQWMLEFFLNEEEYEKCQFLRTLIDKHFIANKNKQKELTKTFNKKMKNIQ